ncbi:MAG: hypothetical protein EOO85_02470 [Pedobacter sp.]|nr:MAG: hypothetical protein EOO85_02470 [Pedobacter sp.]
MNRNACTFILLSLIVLFSCTKENKDKLVIDNREPYLSKIIETKGLISTITEFTYDEKKRLSTAKTGNELITYAYTEDKLTAVEIKNGNISTQVEITYKDNYPSKGISRTYTDGVLTKTLNYDYFSNLYQTGQINIFEPNILTRRLYYEYDNANIISIVGIANRVFTNYDFEYGERKNAFFHASIRWPLAIDNFDRVSTNEILVIKTESNGKIHNKSFNYLYDSDGMPVSAIVTDTDPPSKLEVKSTITYTYEYL